MDVFEQVTVSRAAFRCAVAAYNRGEGADSAAGAAATAEDNWVAARERAIAEFSQLLTAFANNVADGNTMPFTEAEDGQTAALYGRILAAFEAVTR